VTLTDNESARTQTKDRHRWPIIAVAAAAVGAIVCGGLIIAMLNDDDTAEVPAAPPTTVAPPTTLAPPTTVAELAAVSQAPVAVTACVDPVSLLGAGTQNRVAIPSPEGRRTLSRSRGDTYLVPWTEVSDRRLEGTYTQTWNQDEYSADGEAFLSIVVTTDRITNDQGAWQGSHVWYRPAEGDQSPSPLVMVGEGAYEGLTAILRGVEDYGECAVSGYIIEGSIPPPPKRPSPQ
jgi:hypothetical protein